MKIKVYMLTGQNNGEKDVLRAYYRGLVTHFSQSVKVKEELTEFNMQKYIKEIRKIGVEISLDYGEVADETADVGIIFGSAKERENLHHRVRNSVIEKCKNYIVLETPLLARSIVKQSNHDMYRIGLNGFLSGSGEFNNENSNGDRLSKFGDLYIRWKGWINNKDGNILILTQLPGDASLRGSDHGEWLLDTIEELRSITKREIRIRFHPAMSEKGHENFFGDIGKIVFKNYPNIVWSDGIARTLQEDLKEAKTCITYSSGSAIDAIAYGIPTIAVDEGNFAYHVSSKQLEAVETPALASSEEIQQWFNDLSYCQWDRAEMAQGRAWTHIWPKIVDLCGKPEPTE
tara:strand:+ start:264 stop:1298 length:1035 start_codon:yes stop_codon:yes gene_type:complete